jgi:hypothetical protein
MGWPEARKKAWPRYDMVQNILVSDDTAWYIGPRSQPMGGHKHGPFKAGTKRLIYPLKPHFIPHFHVLDKEHKARDDAS